MASLTCAVNPLLCGTTASVTASAASASVTVVVEGVAAEALLLQDEMLPIKQAVKKIRMAFLKAAKRFVVFMIV